MPAPDPTRDPALARRRLRVTGDDEVWLRSVLEGYDGLASLYGDGSGIVTVMAPANRAAELDALLAELSSEAALCALPD